MHAMFHGFKKSKTKKYIKQEKEKLIGCRPDGGSILE